MKGQKSSCECIAVRNLLACTGGWAGDRYKSTLLAVKPQFEAYAAACGSDMAVIDFALDPSGRRSIYTQKLLIPRAFSQYEIVVHMDLDVLIPQNLPDIFSQLPGGRGLFRGGRSSGKLRISEGMGIR